MDLAELTLEKAKELEGTLFKVTLPDGGSTTMKLDEAVAMEVRQRRRRTALKREPFSLYFLGEPTKVLPQGIYHFESEAAKFEALFIVPVSRDGEATEYEAVFT
jgi:hypothetical protein